MIRRCCLQQPDCWPATELSGLSPSMWEDHSRRWTAQEKEKPVRYRSFLLYLAKAPWKCDQPERADWGRNCAPWASQKGAWPYPPSYVCWNWIQITRVRLQRRQALLCMMRWMPSHVPHLPRTSHLAMRLLQMRNKGFVDHSPYFWE